MALESSGDVRVLQPETQWKSILKCKWQPRDGQIEAWKRIITPALVIQPTGYGKTATALGSYVIARHHGYVNRLLVLTATTIQQEQWLRIRKTADLLGIDHTGKCLAVDNSARVLRYQMRGDTEIFVATYGGLISDPRFYQELLSSEQWMVVADECHHLPQDGVWAKAVVSLPYRLLQMLSATPLRTDATPLIAAKCVGESSWEFVPAVHVTRRQALEEKAIRSVRGSAHHYELDVMFDDSNEVVKIDTEYLLSNKISDFQSFEAKRCLRYHSGYLGSILEGAFQCLAEKNSRTPDEHQMLIFAMSCNHAAHVCRILEAAYGPGFANWIGVNEPDGRPRSEKLNTRILADFNKNRFPCLVQVDKAGEGFDNDRCSVLVFLHLIKSETKLPQQIGRGMRRNSRIPWDDDYCVVFYSTDSPLATFIEELEAELGEFFVREKKVNGGPGGVPLYDIPLALLDARLLSVRDVRAKWDQGGQPAETEISRWERALRGAGITEEQIRLAISLYQSHHGGRNEEKWFSETDMIRAWQDSIKRALSTLAGNIARIMFPRGASGDQIGTIKRNLNTKWIRLSGSGHSAMTADDFRAKLKWIQEINIQLKQTKEVPTWLSEQ